MNASHPARPRVLMFLSQFHPIVGGAERQAEKLSLALLERGCVVEILTPRLDPDWPVEEEHRGLPIHRYDLPDLRRRLRVPHGLGIPNLFLQRRATRDAVARLVPDFDVLHAHLASSLAAFAGPAARAAGRPSLCKVACGGSTFDFDNLRATSVAGHAIARRLPSAIDWWIAISGEIRDQLVAAGVDASRIVSIPNGVVVPDRASPPPRTIRRWLFLGRAEKCDYTSLFRAFDALVAKHPDCELMFTAKGAVRPRVEAELARHDRARSRTRLVEFIEGDAAYEWADAVVHPSRAEGIANTLLEGMAAGLPCVASDIPPNREVLDDGRCGELVPVGDADALGAALESAATDPRPFATRAKAAAERVRETYEIGRIADRYLELYTRLLASALRPVAS